MNTLLLEAVDSLINEDEDKAAQCIKHILPEFSGMNTRKVFNFATYQQIVNSIDKIKIINT
jgi:hypothetical protein